MATPVYIYQPGLVPTFEESFREWTQQQLKDISRSLRTIDSNRSKAPSYAVADLPDASLEGAGALVFVTDETGGAVLAFSDGTDWRRSTDRAVVS